MMELTLAIREKLQRIDSCERCGETDLGSFAEDSQLMAVFCDKCHWSCGIDDTFDFFAEEEEIKFSFRNDTIETSTENSLLVDSSNWSEPVDLIMYDFIPYENQDLSGYCKSHELRFQLLDGSFSNPEFLFLEVTCFICNSKGVVFAKEESKIVYNDDDFFKSDEASDFEPFCFFYCERCQNNETDLFSPVLNDYKDVKSVKCLVCENTFDTPQSLNSYQNVLGEYLSLKKPFANLTRVTSYNQLKKGDHIAFMRTLSWVHHAIVTAVEPEQDLVEVIEYGAGEWLESIFRRAEIRRRTVKNLFVEEIEKYEYEAEASYSADETVRRAESRLGEKKQDLLRNDSECFASWCRIGKGSSDGNVTWGALKKLFKIDEINNTEGLRKIFLLLNLIKKLGFVNGLSIGGLLLFEAASFKHEYDKLRTEQEKVKMSDEIFNNRFVELVSERLAKILIAISFGSFTKCFAKRFAKPLGRIILKLVPNVFKNFNLKNESLTMPNEESDHD